MKNDAFASMFLPEKNVAADKIKVMHDKIANVDNINGCHVKSYLDVSLRYPIAHQKKLAAISKLKIPSQIFCFISMFRISIFMKEARIIVQIIAALKIIKNMVDSTKVSVKNAPKILSGTKVIRKTANIIQIHLKLKIKTS